MAKLEKVIYAGTAEKTTIQQVRLRLFCSCGGTCLGYLVMPDFDRETNRTMGKHTDW